MESAIGVGRCAGRSELKEQRLVPAPARAPTILVAAWRCDLDVVLRRRQLQRGNFSRRLRLGVTCRGQAGLNDKDIHWPPGGNWPLAHCYGRLSTTPLVHLFFFAHLIALRNVAQFAPGHLGLLPAGIRCPGPVQLLRPHVWRQSTASATKPGSSERTQ